MNRRRFLLTAAGTAAAATTLGTLTATTADAAPADDVILSTDFAVSPAGILTCDPDDAYDLLCARALGIRKVVLDQPSAGAVAAVQSLGMYAVAPEAMATASTVIVVGSPTLPAEHYTFGQRIILFAGDYTGADEYNAMLDPAAYEFLRGEHNAWWIPCFEGGLWAAGPHASYVQTTDQTLTADLPRARAWLRPRIGNRWGTRNLWGGALLNLAFMNTWGGNGFNSDRVFVASPDLISDMVGGTRWLLERAL